MEFLLDGFRAVTWQQGVMYLVGFALIYLAIQKDYEPALLLPMGFGAILVNLPSSGVLNQMVEGIGESQGIIQWLFETTIEASEALPLLLFIGIGAMIDFGPLLSNPKMLLFGAAAQFGIFFTMVAAVLLGFDLDGRRLHRHHRRGGRPDLHPRLAGAALELRRPHRRRGVLVHGARADHPALRHQARDDEERARASGCPTTPRTSRARCASASRSS